MTHTVEVQVKHPAVRNSDAPADSTARTMGRRSARLVLEDGQEYLGRAFGAPVLATGEVVFNTGMVGYPESLTDPSYCGQILACTYPLIGNYGVPGERGMGDDGGMSLGLESWKIHAHGLLVSDYSECYSHWNGLRSLEQWMIEQSIPGISGIDTRSLTKRLRERGSMLGRIEIEGVSADGPGSAEARQSPTRWYDPNRENLAPKVSVSTPVLSAPRGPRRARVALVDCGAKHNIVRCLVARGLEVLRVPWDWDVSAEHVDGVVLSNGPGDPTFYGATIEGVRRMLDRGTPIFGVCLGNQLLSLAVGARTFKLKYGHRGQNQPALLVGSNRCFVTSQNHGFAVDTATLPRDWSAWFTNLNDGTNEGIRHQSGRWRSVQFHPEAAPGPTDTAFLFEEFAKDLESPGARA